MDKFAVFLDIDDTVYADRMVPERNIIAMNRARELGHYIFLNTARAYGIIPEKILELPIDGVVCGIGTDLRFNGEQIFSHLMTIDECLLALELLDDGVHELVFEGQGICLSRNTGEHHKKYCREITSTDDFKNVKISKIYIARDFTDHERQVLSDDYYLYQHAKYSEYVRKPFTKATGMKKMVEYLGISMKNTIAMGDSSNDLEMLQAAGIAVAMGNAIDEVKEMADFVSIDARDGGVGFALEHFLLT